METSEYRDIDTLDAEDIRNNTEISVGNKFVDFDDFHSRLDEIQNEVEELIALSGDGYDVSKELEDLREKLY